jgi:hypothetical protein
VAAGQWWGARVLTDQEQFVDDMAKKLLLDFDGVARNHALLIGNVGTFNDVMELMVANLFIQTFGQKFAQGCCEDHTGDVAIYSAMGSMAGEVIAARDRYRHTLRNPEVRAKLRAMTRELIGERTSGRA